MTYTYNDVPCDKILWCCAYQTNSMKEDMKLKCLPTKCVIKQSRYGKYCYKVNKNGDIVKSSKINAMSRAYADTYEESCKLYNDRVNKREEWLEKIHTAVRGDYIRDDEGFCC